MSRPIVQMRYLLMIALSGLGAMYLFAPWPGPQAVIHVFIVLGIAPELRKPLHCALLAAVAGWILEIAFRTYSGMGGTPLGNMICALLLWYSLSIGPPEKPFVYYLQVALAAVLHSALVYLFVSIASGPHILGYEWEWVLVLFPLWGPVAWRFYRPPHMRR
ncbi:MAG: hypothetical protein LBH03_07325 [Holophagales bacterium]|jgi:hypothetical protein|nr:hypothetical protein [Holophagales bacterium]